VATTSGATRPPSKSGLLQLIGQRLAEEPSARHDVLGRAQASDGEVAQATADRVADQQRAGEHRHRRRDAEHDGQVGAPVIGGGVEDEAEHAKCFDVTAKPEAGTAASDACRSASTSAA
jgi:hypothetical protein